MKHKNIYTITLLIVSALVLSWAIPALVRMATSTSQNYPFVYYSSILQDFAIREKDPNDKPVFRDLKKGNNYTKEQYDSITPLLSYRQLMLVGKMPDTILNIPVDAKMIKAKSLVWKYSPRDINKPSIKIYSLFESMSGRANLETPDDVFRLNHKIEFITIKNNTVNKEKSDLFQAALIENGFKFPAFKLWGNPSPKKAYDEGYFILDSENQLFHLKMVNGKPYVKNTKAGNNINIAYFSPQEVADKSFYGFIVNKNGEILTLNADGYSVTKMDIPTIDINTNSVMLMANPFYWMVYVTTSSGCTYNVLESGSLKQHDKPFTIDAKVNKWDSVSEWFFPVYINLADRNTEYIQPQLIFNFGKAFIISLVLAIIFTLTIGKERTIARKIADGLIIFIFSIPGLIASYIIKSRKN